MHHNNVMTFKKCQHKKLKVSQFLIFERVHPSFSKCTICKRKMKYLKKIFTCQC